MRVRTYCMSFEWMCDGGQCTQLKTTSRCVEWGSQLRLRFFAASPGGPALYAVPDNPLSSLRDSGRGYYIKTLVRFAHISFLPLTPPFPQSELPGPRGSQLELEES